MALSALLSRCWAKCCQRFSKTPTTRSYVFQFNIVVLMIMVVVYHYPAMYILFCGVLCLILLDSYSQFTMSYGSFSLLFSVLHACFHDSFMEGMGICDNAFVDSHLHYAMLWCVMKMLPLDQQKWFRSNKIIRATLCANFVNCVFGMCLPALINYKETGIMDLKYSHECKNINRLLDWEYIFYGVTSLPSTIAIACYFIAGTIVVRTNNGIHISSAIWIALGIFSCSTAAYFFVDPLWLVHFYNQIKYDQLYFIVPSFYLYLKEKEIKASSANTKCVNCTNLEMTSIECATECGTLVNASRCDFNNIKNEICF